jgi:ribosome-binding factor A
MAHAHDEPSTHQAQSESVIRRAMQEILGRGLSDPRVRGLVSVTRVTLSPDGADVTVHVSVLPEEHATTTLHGLRHASRYLRSELGRRVKLRRVPRLSIRLDDALKVEARTLAAIDEATRGAEPIDADHHGESSEPES